MITLELIEPKQTLPYYIDYTHWGDFGVTYIIPKFFTIDEFNEMFNEYNETFDFIKHKNKSQGWWDLYVWKYDFIITDDKIIFSPTTIEQS